MDPVRSAKIVGQWDKKERTAHFGKNPLKGGMPPSERRRSEIETIRDGVREDVVLCERLENRLKFQKQRKRGRDTIT